MGCVRNSAYRTGHGVQASALGAGDYGFDDRCTGAKRPFARRPRERELQVRKRKLLPLARPVD
jgi:hypothetical protein